MAIQIKVIPTALVCMNSLLVFVLAGTPERRMTNPEVHFLSDIVDVTPQRWSNIHEIQDIGSPVVVPGASLADMEQAAKSKLKDYPNFTEATAIPTATPTLKSGYVKINNTVAFIAVGFLFAIMFALGCLNYAITEAFKRQRRAIIPEEQPPGTREEEVHLCRYFEQIEV